MDGPETIVSGWIDELYAAVHQAASPFEFTTYLLGSHLPESLDPVVARECKRALHRELATRLARSWPDRAPEFGAPDIRILIDVPARVARASSSPVFLAGRYLKLDRELPQSRWPCRRCRSAGCPRCLDTGKTYPESVEEAIGASAMAACGASQTRFHAVGREDVDARMGGTGRPFVLELLGPRRRVLPCLGIEADVNSRYAGRVAVRALRSAAAQDVDTAKALQCEKTYRVVVAASRHLGPLDAARVGELAGVELTQETPSRVLHRRTDLSRARKVFRAEGRALRGGLIEACFRVQSGTYVKELVSGDRGRTTPSLASLLGCSCRVLVLDVLRVHDLLESAP